MCIMSLLYKYVSFFLFLTMAMMIRASLQEEGRGAEEDMY